LKIKTDKVLRVANGVDNLLFNSKEDEIKLLSNKIMNIGKDISVEELIENALCGITMKTLRDNRHANILLNYCMFSISSSLIKFTIKARAGLGMTPDRKF
jgi:hypothetical protein